MKIVYAIPNCNTVKKALDWLKANKLSYAFHDYKKIGITQGNTRKYYHSKSGHCTNDGKNIHNTQTPYRRK